MGPISASRARRALASVLAALALGVVVPSPSPTADAAAMTTQPTEADFLESGEKLAPGQSLLAGRFRLVMQTDGNLVEYGSLGVYDLSPRAYWHSGTHGNPGAFAVMQADGNLVIYSPAGRALWHSGTSGYPGVRAGLLSNGIFVLFSAYDERPEGQLPRPGVLRISELAGEVWDWRLFPGGTMRASDLLEERQRMFQLVMQGDGNLVLMVAVLRRETGPDVYYVLDGYTPYWSSGTYGNPGAFAVMQTDGNLVIYSGTGRALWHTGTYGWRGAHLFMQEDGNLVIYSADGRALWHTRTGGLQPVKR